MKLVLNDGTTIQDGHAGLADGFLWLWLPGTTIQSAAAIAFNQERTKRITYWYGDNLEITYSGFTECVNIMTQGFEIAVCMRRGNEEDV